MFSDPQKNLEQFNLELGARVADLGSGAGFYTVATAKIVGEKGRVYAVDTQKDMLTKIKNNATQARLLNIEAIWGNIEKLGGTRLADASVDAVLVCNILFQLERKDDFPLGVKRILKVKGRVLVVDWKESFGNMGPHADHVVPETVARALFEKVGFTFERSIRAGEHHYGIILRRV